MKQHRMEEFSPEEEGRPQAEECLYSGSSEFSRMIKTRQHDENKTGIESKAASFSNSLLSSIVSAHDFIIIVPRKNGDNSLLEVLEEKNFTLTGDRVNIKNSSGSAFGIVRGNVTNDNRTVNKSNIIAGNQIINNLPKCWIIALVCMTIVNILLMLMCSLVLLNGRGLA